MKYLVCYDISNDKGRRILERNIKEFGIRFQYSIFICELSKDLYLDMKRKIKKCIKHYSKLYEKSDSVMIIPICDSCYSKSDFLLKPYSDEKVIVV